MNKKTKFIVGSTMLSLCLITGCKGGDTPKAKELTKLTVKTTLTSAKYPVGYTFKKIDLNVTAFWSDDSLNTVKEDDYTVLPELPYKFKTEDIGEQEFKVTYSGKTTPVKVNVLDTFYTVNFVTDDGTEISSSTVRYDDKVKRPSEDPKKVGYVFDDWYTTTDGITKFDFDNTTIKEDTTIYGHLLKDVELKREEDQQDPGKYYYQYIQTGSIPKGTKYRLTATKTTDESPNITYLSACNANYYTTPPGGIYYSLNTNINAPICITKISKYDSAKKTTSVLAENKGFKINTYSNTNYVNFYNLTNFNANDKLIVDCLITKDITDNGIWFFSA